MKESNKQRTKRKEHEISENEFNKIFAEATITPEFVEKMPNVILNSSPSYNVFWWVFGIVVGFGLLLLI